MKRSKWVRLPYALPRFACGRRRRSRVSCQIHDKFLDLTQARRRIRGFESFLTTTLRDEFAIMRRIKIFRDSALFERSQDRLRNMPAIWQAKSTNHSLSRCTVE